MIERVIERVCHALGCIDCVLAWLGVPLVTLLVFQLPVMQTKMRLLGSEPIASGTGRPGLELGWRILTFRLLLIIQINPPFPV